MLLFIVEVKAPQDERSIRSFTLGFKPQFKLFWISSQIGVEHIHHTRAVQAKVHRMNLIGCMRLQLPLSEMRGRAPDDRFFEDNLFICIVLQVRLVRHELQLFQIGLQDRVDHLVVHVRLLDLVRLKVLGFPRQFRRQRIHDLRHFRGCCSAVFLRHIIVLQRHLVFVDFVRESLALGSLLLDIDLPAIDVHGNQDFFHLFPRRVVLREWIGQGFLPASLHLTNFDETLARSQTKEMIAESSRSGKEA